MNRRDFIKTASAGLLGAMAIPNSLFAAEEVQFKQDTTKPNIVVFMSDDQRWSQTGYYGHPILKTPVLDDMAASGLRLDRFYAAPVCGPARASMLTGRQSNRTGCLWAFNTMRLKEITIAQELKKAGYATAHFGKWHVGSCDDGSAYAPKQRGFDENVSTWNQFGVNPRFLKKYIKEGEKRAGSDIIAELAVKFIKKSRDANKPSLTIIWTAAPHGLWDTTKEYSDIYKGIKENKHGSLQQHYGEISEVDHAVGIVRKGLKDLEIRDNTMFLFCSDNGYGDPHLQKLKGSKGGVYEGGLRVPAIIEWPNMIKKNRVSNVPCSIMDLLPTALDICGREGQQEAKVLDGISIKGIIDGTMTERPKPIGAWAYNSKRHKTKFFKPKSGGGNEYLWTSPEDRKEPLPKMSAWIDNKYKLVVGGSKSDKVGKVELYDIINDMAESKNIASANPEIVAKMKKELDEWKASVEKSMRGDDYKQLLSLLLDVKYEVE